MFRRTFMTLALALAASPLLAAEHVIHVSVDGLRPDYLQTIIDAGEAPNFKRFQTEGAWTTQARTDYTHTVTLPNHTSMLTGRPVSQPVGQPNTLHHGWVTNVNPAPTATLHNSGNLNVPYKASAFDVVHDAGLETALYASKSKFVLYEQSYNATTGAPHANGQDKIDVTRIDESSAVMQNLLLADLTVNHPNYSFVHYADPDDAGHSAGWGTVTWQNAVKAVDAYVGQLFNLIENDPVLDGRTAIVLTADHGGNGTSHGTASLAANYTIPFFVWGVGVAHGDLYEMNLQSRTHPGTTRPDYNAASQPIRNGDGGNLALSLLGLSAVPGSLINASQDLRVTWQGDFTGDTNVDGADLAIWQSGFGGSAAASHAQGDADGDQDVDGADFLWWQRQANITTATVPVPEPTTGILASLAMLLAATSARRHRCRVG